MRSLLLAALLLAACGDRAASASGPDVLTGYLRFAGGPSTSAPVTVAVYRGGHRVAVDTASDSGRFRFRLARGSYDLRAKAGDERCERHVAVNARLVRTTLPCLGGMKLARLS